MFQEYINDNRLAGATVLVMRDGQPSYVKAFGWAARSTSASARDSRLQLIPNATDIREKFPTVIYQALE